MGRNTCTCFHFEYSLSSVTFRLWLRGNRLVAVWISSFTLTNYTKLLVMLAKLLMNTESDRVVYFFWETTVYLEWMNKGMEHDTSFH